MKKVQQIIVSRAVILLIVLDVLFQHPITIPLSSSSSSYYFCDAASNQLLSIDDSFPSSLNVKKSRNQKWKLDIHQHDHQQQQQHDGHNSHRELNLLNRTHGNGNGNGNGNGKDSSSTSSSSSSSSSLTILQLIGTGIVMGIIHVLTGPDHISALATIASSNSNSNVNVNSSRSRSSYSLCGLGVRWGIGHSTGLLVVGSIFILKDLFTNNDTDNNDNDATNDHRMVVIPHSVSMIFESLVGIFMLLLGIHGIYAAYQWRYDPSSKNKGGREEYSLIDNNNMDHDDCDYDNDSTNNNVHNSSSLGSTTTIGEVELVELGNTSCDNSISSTNSMRRRKFNTNKNSKSYENTTSSFDNSYDDDDDDLEEFRYNVQVMLGTVRPSIKNSSDPETQDTDNENLNHHSHGNGTNSACLACTAGIFHGLAGPGGVLGVIPALQLHNAGKAACYLGSFCVASTLTMGLFASCYGTTIHYCIHQGDKGGQVPTKSTTTAVAARTTTSCAITEKKKAEDEEEVNDEDEDGDDGDDETQFEPQSDASEGSKHDNDDDNTNEYNDSNNSNDRNGRTIVIEYWIRCISSSFSIIVGILWIVLLLLGKLEDVFG